MIVSPAAEFFVVFCEEIKYIDCLKPPMVAENIQHIRRRIASACSRVGRIPDDVTLVAVSKTFSSPLIGEAVQFGVNDFGENFVQELRKKQEELSVHPIRWHFIGHLQSNKIKFIADSVFLIHSVDSLGLGKALSVAASRSNRTLEILVEVNTSGEASKFGATPKKAPELVRSLSALERIRVVGIMTIGPFLPDPEQSRPAFQELRHVRDLLRRDGFPMPRLSMGMTNDFEVAIEEGSTIVRIGTGIFGSRTKHLK